MSTSFKYGIEQLTVGKALHIANGSLVGKLGKTCRKKVKKSREIVEKIARGKTAVYGINTGFGPLCSTMISVEDTSKLQYNILKSHSVGVGKPIPKEIAKLMLILKMQSLAQGFSGIAITTLERIQWHIEQDIIPIVPEKGSVGASGDLAPLAHLFLPLIGLGEVWYKGKIVATKKVFKKEGLKSITLGAKEGLALINGTQFITAYAVKVVEKLHSCLSQADLIGAMMLEGLLGSASPFLAQLHQLRPYAGNKHVAQRIQHFLKDSQIVNSHEGCDRVQDPYSLRCMPQVHGSSRTSWLHLKQLVEIELNAVTDNPVIIKEDLTISGGNFHGQPLALPLDYACIAASELGNISDRRVYLSLTGVAKSVPKLLMKKAGLNSAFMMLQYTTAALASENKGLCFPASADSIPTSLGQEDHVSMGSIGGRKALQVIENVEKILAIELICAAQSFDYHKPLKSSLILESVHTFIRTKISHAEEDRVFAKDIEKAIAIIENRTILKVATKQSNFKTDFDKLFENY
ncbi:MAG: histidine ammonia-lyase [Saprospiraceae bacterium]